MENMIKLYGFNVNEIVCKSDEEYGFNINEIVRKSDEEKLYSLDKDKLVETSPTTSSSTLQNNESSNGSDISTREEYLRPDFSNIGEYTSSAGLTDEQKKNLNMMVARNMIGLQVYRGKKKIDLEYQRKKAILRSQNQNTVGTSRIDCNGIVVANSYEKIPANELNDDELIGGFISEKFLLKNENLSTKSNYAIMYRDPELGRYVKLDKKTIKELLTAFILSNCHVKNIEATIERMYRQLTYNVPYLKALIESQKLRKCNEYELVFLNGILDLKSGEFTVSDTTDVFNTYSLPYNWREDVGEPEVFDALLDDCFGKNEQKKQLQYEYIGAILSGIPIIKKIFVNQGVSNGGKSRLHRIIASLVSEVDVRQLDCLSDLVDLPSNEKLSDARLIVIDEMPNKRLSPNQVSTLKKYANGEKHVRILINTNNAIFTEKDGSIEKALHNRLAVMPFEKSMDNENEEVVAFEDIYLESERFAIVRKALASFHRVIMNSKSMGAFQFSHQYPVNCCIEDSVDVSRSETDVEAAYHQRSEELLQQKSKESNADPLMEVLSTLYYLDEDVNPNMTTENIMHDVNELLGSETFKDAPTFGKELKSRLGNKLKSERKNQKTCYNLRYNVPHGSDTSLKCMSGACTQQNFSNCSDSVLSDM